jgi:hypothetical protein
MKDNGSKSLLAIAIEREDWEVAALCLALGVLKAAEELPQETLDALLDELDFEDQGPYRIRRQRKGRGPHGEV